jgi:hypothetical protein
MVDENIKDFTVNWIIFGLLTFCLISFTISFMYNNNPEGFDDGTDDKFSNLNSGIGQKLLASEQDADVILNITANTNPEASQLGSRDSVAAAYETKATATGFFSSMKLLISWIVVGEMGKMLLAVFGGIVGFLSVYFIVKWIRNGI